MRSTPEGTLSVQRKERAFLKDGQPVAFAISPIASEGRQQSKPMESAVWQAVRQPGVATLLTGTDGQVIYESSMAAVLAFDGYRLVMPPLDTPCVESLAAEAIARAHPPLRLNIRIDTPWPVALANAVAGVCVPVWPGKPTFPLELKVMLCELLERTAE